MIICPLAALSLGGYHRRVKNRKVSCFLPVGQTYCTVCTQTDWSIKAHIRYVELHGCVGETGPQGAGNDQSGIQEYGSLGKDREEAKIQPHMGSISKTSMHTACAWQRENQCVTVNEWQWQKEKRVWWKRKREWSREQWGNRHPQCRDFRELTEFIRQQMDHYYTIKDQRSNNLANNLHIWNMGLCVCLRSHPHV